MVEKEFIFRNIVDPLMCPPKVIDKNGEDANTKNEFLRNINKAEFVTGLLTTTSAIAIGMLAFGEYENIKFWAAYNAAGYALSNAMIWAVDAREELFNKASGVGKESGIKYFVDRTKKQEALLAPNIEIDLELRQTNAKRFLLKSFGVAAFLTAMQPMLFTPAVVFSLRGGSNFWQNKRSLSGEWNVTGQPPRPKIQETSLREQTPALAYAPV